MRRRHLSLFQTIRIFTTVSAAVPMEMFYLSYRKEGLSFPEAVERAALEAG